MLLGKAKLHSQSIMSQKSEDGNQVLNESIEKIRMEHEVQEHKWNAEKLKLQAQMKELEQTIKSKDQEAAAA